MAPEWSDTTTLIEMERFLMLGEHDPAFVSPSQTLYFPNTFLLHDVCPKFDLLICKREMNHHNHFYDLF